MCLQHLLEFIGQNQFFVKKEKGEVAVKMLYKLQITAKI